MTLWFVSRHPGALEWMKQSGTPFDRHVDHLNPEQVAVADTVIGSLPVNLAAEVCQRGARYVHLSLRLDPQDRGQELSAQQLHRYQATLEEFFVRKTK